MNIIEAESKTFNWREIRKDHLGWVRSASTKNLAKAISIAKAAYYNTGKPIVSDKIFDAIESALRAKAPNHPALSKVGSTPTSRKVPIPYYMGSLDKAKTTEELDSWAAGSTNFVVSDKIDGVSLLIISDKGKYSLYSRGDGTVGQDISHMRSMLDLPKTTRSFVVRAELVVTKSRFNRIQGYATRTEGPVPKNPRNFVSGLVNSKSASQNLKKVDIIAYELIKPEKKPSDQFRALEDLGFDVPKYKVTGYLGGLRERYRDRKSKSKYDIDGLVITKNEKYRRATSGNPKYSVAFKTFLEEDLKQARVVKVEWQLSKYSHLIPVIFVEAV